MRVSYFLVNFQETIFGVIFSDQKTPGGVKWVQWHNKIVKIQNKSDTLHAPLRVV